MGPGGANLAEEALEGHLHARDEEIRQGGRPENVALVHHDLGRGAAVRPVVGHLLLPANAIDGCILLGKVDRHEVGRVGTRRDLGGLVRQLQGANADALQFGHDVRHRGEHSVGGLRRGRQRRIGTVGTVPGIRLARGFAPTRIVNVVTHDRHIAGCVHGGGRASFALRRDPARAVHKRCASIRSDGDHGVVEGVDLALVRQQDAIVTEKGRHVHVGVENGLGARPGPRNERIIKRLRTVVRHILHVHVYIEVGRQHGALLRLPRRGLDTLAIGEAQVEIRQGHESQSLGSGRSRAPNGNVVGRHQIVLNAVFVRREGVGDGLKGGLLLVGSVYEIQQALTALELLIQDGVDVLKLGQLHLDRGQCTGGRVCKRISLILEIDNHGLQPRIVLKRLVHDPIRLVAGQQSHVLIRQLVGQ